MSVKSPGSDIEKDLADLEAQAIKELETPPESTPPDDKSKVDPESKPEGESETPESESTPGKETTTTTPEGGEEKPEDNKSKDPAGEADPEKPEGGEEGKHQPSKRAQSRQKELANKLRDSEIARQALEKQLAELQKKPGRDRVPERKSKLPWDKDEEITIEDYEKDVESKAQEVVKEQLKIRDLTTNVSSDIARLRTEFPELDDDNEAVFDQDLVDFIIENWKERLKINRELRLYDYASKIMELRSKAAESAKAEAQRNLRKNMATQPITGATKTEKSTTVDDLVKGAKTIEELDAIAEKNLPIAGNSS